MSLKIKQVTGNNYYDAEFVNVQKGYVLSFFHIPSGVEVQFKALITKFSDQFESNWKSEDVYGRNDPIENFQSTKRVITLSWDVVAASFEEAKYNLERSSVLFSMLYPSYTEYNNAGSIAASPLFKVGFANLIQSMEAFAGQRELESITAAATGVKTGSGLVCRIAGFTYEPVLEAGCFDDVPGLLYPQTIQLNAQLTIYHTHPLGWNIVGRMRTAKFPYGESAREVSPSSDVKTTSVVKGTKEHQEAKEGAVLMSSKYYLWKGV